MIFYCIDFESNGAVNGLEPIEFAWVKICGNTGNILQFQEYGFTSGKGGRQLVNQQKSADHLRDLWQNISENLQGQILCGHNISFDFAILNKTFPGFKHSGLIDTLTLYRQLYGKQIANYALTDLLQIFELSDLLENLRLNDHFEPHRALYDAYGCALLIQRLLQNPQTAKIFNNFSQPTLF